MATYSLPIATTTVLGGVKVDGTTITINSTTGVISAASAGSYASATLTGTTTIQHATEIVTTLTGATGTVVHDYSTGGSIWYHTNIASNFTANFTNLPTTNNRSITTTLVLIQGSTPYIPYAVSIEGVSQNLYWVGTAIGAGIQPTGYALKKDFVTFTLLRVNNTWTITAALNSYG
jgi:hypothetical protein